MKIGIVGCGFVGATAAYALVMRGVGSELVLVDKFRERARAEAEDIFHAVPFAHPIRVVDADYDALDGARVVIIAAGVNQKPGETRLQLLERNSAIFREIVPQILKYAPDAVLLVATNPVDVMTHLTAHIAAEHGLATGRVFGSGTTLDTARFRALLSERLGVDSQHVHGYVVGEHGDSEVLLWSSVSVAGIALDEFARLHQIEVSAAFKAEIDEGVRRAAYKIIQGKNATYYGIGSALSRITDAILSDQRAILTVCAPTDTLVGAEGVTLSLPRLIGGTGVMETFPVALNATERASLLDSAAVIRTATEQTMGN